MFSGGLGVVQPLVRPVKESLYFYENFVCILNLIGIYTFSANILPHRLMVGQQTLTLLIVVRIHVRQPSKKSSFGELFFVLVIWGDGDIAVCKADSCVCLVQ